MPLTPEQRAFKVQQAIIELANSIASAIESLETNGAADQRTLDAWESVEKSGAVVHRQSRLLAGKSKGG